MAVKDKKLKVCMTLLRLCSVHEDKDDVGSKENEIGGGRFIHNISIQKKIYGFTFNE